jgi:hypothetical protein
MVLKMLSRQIDGRNLGILDRGMVSGMRERYGTPDLDRPFTGLFFCNKKPIIRIDSRTMYAHDTPLQSALLFLRALKALV